MLVAAGALLAIGETILAISLPALVNDLAPETLRGRYNGVFLSAGTAGMIIAPLLTGGLLQLNHPRLLMLFLATASLVLTYPCLRLERHLPTTANLVSS
ncbi:MFS transporter [Streptomyces sp. NPDC059688]|uniref:MFS transporter n=1 Tax=Streptomyces sp. NPDC059688 TaxID=3346906 RepID=UPI0036846BE4